VMEINRYNYEETLIDFMEGNLSKAELSELFLFLDANPDIKAEFDLLRNDIPSIVATTVDFPSKAQLIKKQVGSEFLDEFSWLCIAKLEGDATQAELAQLHDLIKKNPSLKEESLLFEKMRLHPSTTVIFDQKSRLARHRVGFASSIARYAVAASVAAVIVMVSFPVGNIHNNSRTLSYNTPTQPTTIEIVATVNKPSVGKVVAVKVEKQMVASLPSSLADSLSKIAARNKQTQQINSTPLLATVAPMDPAVEARIDQNISIKHNSENASVKDMDPAENPSRYLSVGEFLAQKVVGENSIDPTYATSSSRAKFWQVAQVGIRGASRLLGIPVKIDKEYDQSGNLKKISIDSKLLALSRSF